MPIFTFPRPTTILRRAVLVLVALQLAGCSRPAAPDPAIDKLLTLMQQRLALMPDVARWKWNHELPVADPAREQTLLDGLVERGRSHGLEPGTTRTFFAAQIKAARLVQQQHIDRWKAESHAPFDNVPKLTTETRIKIDKLNSDLLTALSELQPRLADPATREAIHRRATAILIGEPIDDAIRASAIEPLVERMKEEGGRMKLMSLSASSSFILSYFILSY